jgi:hypothetical protein
MPLFPTIKIFKIILRFLTLSFFKLAFFTFFKGAVNLPIYCVGIFFFLWIEFYTPLPNFSWTYLKRLKLWSNRIIKFIISSKLSGYAIITIALQILSFRLLKNRNILARSSQVTLESYSLNLAKHYNTDPVYIRVWNFYFAVRISSKSP